MKPSTVRIAQIEYVRTITLDRPDQLNAMNDQLLQELAEALKDAAAHVETRCVVVTGAGRAFCAGRDIADLREVTAHDVFAPAVDLTAPMTKSGKIFVAAINGPVAGAALGFIMAADFRLASADATFTPGFITLGLAPDVGASLMGHAIGYSKALGVFAPQPESECCQRARPWLGQSCVRVRVIFPRRRRVRRNCRGSIAARGDGNEAASAHDRRLYRHRPVMG